MNEVYSVVLDIRTYLSSPQSPDAWFRFFQEPARIEDALGRVFPFPSEYSYKDLEAIIHVRFKDSPGHDLVEGGRWELYDRRRNTRVIPSESSTELLPGMDLKMAIMLSAWQYLGTVTTNAEALCPLPRCRSSKIESVFDGGRKW